MTARAKKIRSLAHHGVLLTGLVASLGACSAGASDDEERLGESRSLLLSAPITVFNGLTSLSQPPDTIGEVGPSHFVQAVNDASFGVWNKSGVMLSGPTSLGSLWPAGPCVFDFTDPTVNYDHLADRWLISQIASDGAGLCLAVSRTGLPGTTPADWFLYDIRTPTFPDYQKIGVWPDGYYFTTFEDVELGMFVLDRANLLTGNGGVLTVTCQTSASRCLRTTIPALGQEPVVRSTRLLPADLDGPAPPAGTPGLFLRTVDDQQDPDNPVDRLQIFSAVVNWTAQTWTVTAQPDLLPAPFDIMLCNRNGDGVRDCIPQPDGGVTLDALSNRPMMALRYRQSGGQASMVFTQTVDVADQFPGIATGEVAGKRWYNLRNNGGGWAIQDQGDFAPQDGPSSDAELIHRWMGSAAMDRVGNIAVGYSAVNSDSAAPLFPAIAYAGRLATDPPGTMNSEQVVAESSGPAFVVDHRWGDYSALSIDPSDDCTFWYTAHMSGGESRIASFRFDECTPAAPAVCVLGAMNVDLRDRANVTAETAAGAFLQLGAPATLNGNGRSGGNALIRSNGVVNGNLTLAGTLSTQGPFTVTGTLIQNGNPVIPSLLTETFSTGSGFQTISGTVTLPPGNRGNVTIAAGANVTLTAGTYNFASLNVQPDANVIIVGAVDVNVQGNLEFGDRTDILGTGSLSAYSNGATVRIGTDATFRGVLSAPNANLTVSSRTRVDGCVGARNVVFEPDSRLLNAGQSLPVN